MFPLECARAQRLLLFERSTAKSSEKINLILVCADAGRSNFRTAELLWLCKSIELTSDGFHGTENPMDTKFKKKKKPIGPSIANARDRSVANPDEVFSIFFFFFVLQLSDSNSTLHARKIRSRLGSRRDLDDVIGDPRSNDNYYYTNYNDTYIIYYNN